VLWSPSTIHFFSFSDAFRNRFAGAADTNRLELGVDEVMPHAAEWLYARAANREQVANWSLPDIRPALREYQKTSRRTSVKLLRFPAIFA
jgi:hypothetical protein